MIDENVERRAEALWNRYYRPTYGLSWDDPRMIVYGTIQRSLRIAARRLLKAGL